MSKKIKTDDIPIADKPPAMLAAREFEVMYSRRFVSLGDLPMSAGTDLSMNSPRPKSPIVRYPYVYEADSRSDHNP